MGLHTKERAQVNEFLPWEFIPIIYKINNILPNEKYNNYRMFTRDSQHLPTPTCASLAHNAIKEGHPDTNPKNFVHEWSDQIHLTLGNILHHLLFNFWPYKLILSVGLLFTLHKYRTKLTICFIKKF